MTSTGSASAAGSPSRWSAGATPRTTSRSRGTRRSPSSAGTCAAWPVPDEAIFYTSGRTSNEAAFAYQLFVRAYGTNNMPDCSNMCHESTSLALADAIGIGKGSVHLDDIYDAELLVLVGQNPGTNHPRMLTALERAKRNGAKILAINPLREAGSGEVRQPADAARPHRRRHRAGRPAPARAAQRRPRPVPGDRCPAARVGLHRPRLRHPPHHRLRRLGTAPRRPRLGGRRAGHRAAPPADRGRGPDVRRIVGHGHVLGDGHHPAPQRRGDDPRDRQRRPPPGQHRQARRRPVPGARALQRAGRPDDGDLGEAVDLVPRQPRRRVRLRAAARARPGHRRLDPRRCATAGRRCSSPSAGTSSRRCPTPRSPRRRCAAPSSPCRCPPS